MIRSSDHILHRPLAHARFGRAGEWAASWRRRQALRQKLPRAFATFANRYPTWADSFFDRHFLAHRAGPLLASGTPDAATMASAWADQFHWANAARRRNSVAAILPVVSDFLDLLACEMPSNS
jgi:hypothetical protein